MRCVTILVEEHRWIRSLVDCLSKVISIYEAGGGLNARAVQEVLDLFEAFADGSHQDKEERCLFPRLRTRATEREAQILKTLSADHARDRQSFASLHAELLIAMSRGADAKREFIAEAGRYVRTQRDHMKTENAILFAMAERLLTLEDDAAILEEFDRLDHSGTRGGEYVRGRIESLCKQLGVRVGS